MNYKSIPSRPTLNYRKCSKDWSNNHRLRVVAGLTHLCRSYNGYIQRKYCPKTSSEKRNGVGALLKFDLRGIRVCFSLNPPHFQGLEFARSSTATVAGRVLTMFNNVLGVTTCREHWTDIRERSQTRRLAGT